MNAPRTLIEAAAELGRAFAARAAEHDRTGATPVAQFDALERAGLLRANIPADEGGHGAGLAVSRAIVSEIARGDPSVALILSMHYCQHAIITRAERTASDDWPPALARRLRRASVEGRALLNAAQVEPALGSPSFGGLPDTIAHRTRDGWRISGHKVYVTGAPLLAWINVLARTDEDEPRLGHFLVPRDAPGVRIVETWDPIGMRASASHDVLFDDVALALDDAVALQPASLDLQRNPHSVAWYLSLIGSVYDGVARAARDWIVSFVKERKPSALGGAPLATVSAVQEGIGRIETLLATSDWLLDSHARSVDTSEAPDALAAVVKHAVIANAIEAVDVALDLAGNHGLARRNPLERHYRDVQCGRVHAPVNGLIRANAGRAALGVLPRAKTRADS
ncbi:acyl-CoA/acyl-ACP dehydrogenase [Caballeronia sp. EK]|uniref:acyl-CoA dehydrogenase family protein n=1 Tax=Caballeronia sp. EK TaxID=2767469 RepID=UPI000783B906|nr:acyl-CoA dehydrogenase family protein [Caballeronia sp. EK]KXU96886.1 acyl-CoA dehydrogenase [Caballeronia megalochromosomata]MBC8640631.1 acyl-CoA/acyl-ACP dehydrogenase [Caballeronia sp. EK]